MVFSAVIKDFDNIALIKMESIIGIVCKYLHVNVVLVNVVLVNVTLASQAAWAVFPTL